MTWQPGTLLESCWISLRQVDKQLCDNMPFDGPVCLTRSAPSDAYADQLIFYDVVDASIYSRSSVLSSIVEAGGEAILPDLITLAEFKAWLTAIKTDRKEVECWSFSSMCTLLKTADVLGDAYWEEWIRLAARCLPAKSTWLAGKRIAEEASQGIDKLSAALQRHLFAAAADTPTHLCRLLDLLPSKHHAAVLEATITDAKSLKAPLRESLHVAKALPCIPASHPSLLSLDVHDFASAKPLSAESPPAQQALSLLAEALHQHSSLTSLRVMLPCITSSSFKPLSLALASLQSLQSLVLDTRIGPDSLPTLQQTLAALPNLQRLSIAFASSETLKRQREAKAARLRQHCLSSMLSAATALTSLDLSTVCKEEYLTATSAVTLPGLHHLAMHFACNHTSAAASLLSHLSAPLTSLNMHFGKSLFLPSSARRDAQHLFTSLMKFTKLQALALAIPQDERPSDRAIRKVVSAAAPTTLAALPHLVSLSIRSELPVLQQVISVLAEGSSEQGGLTELCLNCCSTASTSGLQPGTGLLQQLTSLRLQRLKVEVCNLTAAEMPGLAALPRLPHLTALSLNNWACLTDQADCEALARMTQLQKLHLIGMRLRPWQQYAFARSLGVLSALTSLLFRSATEDGSITRMLYGTVPEGALPLLQELGVDAWWPSDSLGAILERHADDEGTPEPFSYVGEVEDIIRSAGSFAMHLPELTRLDIFFEEKDCSRAGVDKLQECLEDMVERGLVVEVTHEGQLLF